ncbi:MAG: YrdB family protein [Actinomycetota bacterium]|nr:YrdB family protein [Actinomycetota bacterium]MDH5223699.1 YrdB family protein [Actinomycetota bacterium]MDH5313277.1 YrdB family protein [Actinomycetota bacterium]
MSLVRVMTLAVRFGCELGMYAALAVWGAHVGEGVAALALAVAAPLIVAMVWWMFVAPKARRPVPLAARVAVELVIFGTAALALWSTDRPVLAMVLGVLALVTSMLNAVQERAGSPTP